MLTFESLYRLRVGKDEVIYVYIDMFIVVYIYLKCATMHVHGASTADFIIAFIKDVW